MDNRQLVGNRDHNDQLEFSARQANIWTSMPGIIQSIDFVAMTCTVQVAIKAKRFKNKQQPFDEAIPLLVDAPVQFPAGGGNTLTFPVKAGDECLVHFASRCIDNWWQNGGVQTQAEMRMHDLSDGFVSLGYRSQPRVIPNISSEAVQLRSDDGQTFVEVNPSTHKMNVVTPTEATVTAGQKVTVVATTSVDITAPNINLNGNVNITGNISTAGGDGKGSGTFTGSLSVTGVIHSDTEVNAPVINSG